MGRSDEDDDLLTSYVSQKRVSHVCLVLLNCFTPERISVDDARTMIIFSTIGGRTVEEDAGGRELVEERRGGGR